MGKLPLAVDIADASLEAEGGRAGFDTAETARELSEKHPEAEETAETVEEAIKATISGEGSESLGSTARQPSADAASSLPGSPERNMTEFEAYQSIVNYLIKTRHALDAALSRIAVEAPSEVHMRCRKLVEDVLDSMLDQGVVPMVGKFPILEQDHVWKPVGRR